MYANLTTNPSISPSLAFNTGAGQWGSHEVTGIRDGDVIIGIRKVRIFMTQ